MSTHYYLENNEKTKNSQNMLDDLRALKKGKDPIWIYEEENNGGEIHLTLETDKLDEKGNLLQTDYAHSYHYPHIEDSEYSLYLVRYGANDVSTFLHYLVNKYDTVCIDEDDDGMAISDNYIHYSEDYESLLGTDDGISGDGYTEDEAKRFLEGSIKESYERFDKHPSELTMTDYFKDAKKRNFSIGRYSNEELLRIVTHNMNMYEAN